MQNSNVKYIKIHPAIGVARLANNDDYFEFFEAYARNFSPSEDFMSGGGPNDPKPGTPRIKKQAVQFKAFAYDGDNNLLGEVGDVLPNAQVRWSADVGNRKLFNYSSKRGGTSINPVSAQATTSNPEDRVALNGKNPWKPNETINLGSITGTGLFIPAKGGVTRENTNSPIDHYPADQGGQLQTTDTTCDGEISAELFDASGSSMNMEVIPAWIVSAPSQHCLTLTPAKAEEVANNFGAFRPSNRNNNKDWVESTKSLLGIRGDIDDPTGLDLPMMLTMNADYNPGMEVNIGRSRLETGLQAANLFYPRGEGPIRSNEIRVRPHAAQDAGTIPGQITSGLCSTWQGDMMLCLNWWTAENPSQAFLAGSESDPVIVVYKEGNTSTQMNEPEEINEHMDFRGIADYQPDEDDIKINLDYDPNRP